MHTQAHNWDLSAWIIGRALEGFEGDDWRTRPGGMSHALWVLGHILNERRETGRILGGDFPETLRDRLFAQGTSPDDVPAGVDPEDVLRDFGDTHEAFLAFLEGLDDAALEEAVDVEIPRAPNTKLAALQFMLTHESYHVGQLGALRVLLGKGGWASKSTP